MTTAHALPDGRTLRLTPADNKPGVFICEILKPNGDLAWMDKPIDLTKDAHRKKLQGQGVPLDEILGLQARLVRARAEAGEAPRVAISYRGMKAPASTSETVEGKTALAALDELLAMPADQLPPEAYIFWEDAIELRAVDIDWHGSVAAPPAHEVERLLLAIRPTASRYWTTHGGGGRLIYTRQGSFTAKELAACAAARIMELAPTATVEIKCDTRHPAALRDGKPAGKVGKAPADTTLAVIGRFAARGCSDADRDAWLQNQGLELGQNYAHHACPIDAGHISTHATPVFTGDNGIFCASCASRLGDGFRSYGRLTGASPAQAANPIYEAARAFVHWDQAAYYFQALAADIHRDWRRPIYSALLRYLHPEEPTGGRVSVCFSPFPYVRGDGGWLHAETLRPRAPSLNKGDLKGVPWALRWSTNDDGVSELGADPVRLGQLEGNGICKGLLPVAPVRGSPIYAVHNALNQSARRLLVTPTAGNPQARYLSRRDRASEKEVGAFLGECFPEINLPYLKLCHVARGCAEFGDGMLPIIYAHGPSGAGKTATGTVETTMAGDTDDDIGMVNMEQLAEAIGAAAATSGHIFLNEFSKINKACRGRAVNAILQLGRSHTYRQPYAGVISVENHCYVLLTDKDLPYEIRSNEQFGRRVVYVPLRTPVPDWTKGPTSPKGWLTAPEGQRIADSLHSWIVDEYFPANAAPRFVALAKDLGFLSLDKYFLNSEEGSMRSALARDLFLAVAAAKEGGLEGWGRGWVALELGSETQITNLVRQLTGLRGEDPTAETLVEALEPVAGRWHTILDLRGPARLETKKHGIKSYIRFRSDDSARQGYAINGELLKADNPTDRSTPTTPTNSDRTPTESQTTVGSDSISNIDNSDRKEVVNILKSENNIQKELIGPRNVGDDSVGVSLESVATTTTDNGSVQISSLSEFSDTGKILHLDLETRSRSDLKRTGAWRYSTDPSTGVVCLAALLDGAWITRAYAAQAPYEMPPEIAAALPTLTIAAHNVAFEQALWRNVLHWPEPGRGWFCTMALAATKGLPLGLDNIAPIIGQPGKEEAGYKIMMRSCKPDRTGEFPILSEAEMATLLSYCRHDVEVEHALAEKYGTALPAFEADVFRAHTAVNERGIRIDPELCSAGLRLVATIAAEAGEAAEKATEGAIKPSDLTRLKFLRQWLATQGHEVDSLDSADVDRLLRKDLTPAVRAVLEARSKVSRSSVAKLAAMLDAADPTDNRVRGCFMYHGALHGRWTGKLFQPQNLVKCTPGIDAAACVEAVLSGDPERVKAAGNGDPEEALVACIRPAIVAAPGKSLVIVDLAAIEARGVVWVANDEAHLEQFRQNDRGIGKDPYCHMGDKLFGREILKGRDKKERDASKEPVLGGGYGMGGKRMDERCKEKGIDLPALGLTGKMVIGAYQAEYAAVCAKRTGVWAKLDQGVRRCLESRKTVTIGAEGNPATFSLEGTALKLTLPSGRPLYFHNPRLEDELVKWSGGEFIAKVFYYDDMSSGRVKRTKVWGGTWLEYIVSGHSRDLVARALIACGDDLPVIQHCHDELVVEVDDAKAEAALAALIGHLTHVPSWSAGFPIAAEGHISKRYLK